MDVITQEQTKTYRKVSRYSGTPIFYHKDDKKWFGGITKWLRDDTPYLHHTIVNNDTLDSLALKYYGSPLYYWVIADYNRILDPFIKLKVGDSIKIPTFSSIEWDNFYA